MQHLVERFEDVPHRTYLGHGNVWGGLSGLIRAHAIDLLVVGTHGRAGVGKLLMGSVAEEIFRQASCPVLTVGPKVFGRARLPLVPNWGHDLAPLELELQEIIYATDFSHDSLAAAPYTISLAREFQARLVLLHVLQEYAHRKSEPDPIEAALQQLMGLVPEAAGLWCTPEPVLEFGAPADGILKAASERNADLIVLGVRPPAGHLTAATHLPWRTAHKVVAEASCPVLTIRG
jgi:nucleotide-binding universal stress UspA family protein